jgi:spore coat polysaccharide biosynthesis predicted glycosyltransferase SpsG
MPSLMAWADIAVTGGGSTSWESAFMGLPSLVLVLADNQSAIASGLHEAGVALNLGSHKNVGSKEIVTKLKALMGNQRWRKQMSLLGKRLVDGQGSKRVLRALAPNEKSRGEDNLP